MNFNKVKLFHFVIIIYGNKNGPNGIKCVESIEARN